MHVGKAVARQREDDRHPCHYGDPGDRHRRRRQPLYGDARHRTFANDAHRTSRVSAGASTASRHRAFSDRSERGNAAGWPPMNPDRAIAAILTLSVLVVLLLGIWLLRRAHSDGEPPAA